MPVTSKANPKTTRPQTDVVGMLPGSDVMDDPVQVNGSLVWTGPFEVPPQETVTLLYQAGTPEGEDWLELCNQVEADAEGELLESEETCVIVAPPISRQYLPLVANEHRPASVAMAKSVTPEFVTTDWGQVVTYTGLDGGLSQRG